MKASPYIIPIAFDSEKCKLPFEAIVGASNKLNQTIFVQTWNDQNSVSKASPDIIPIPFDSGKCKPTFETIVGA